MDPDAVADLIESELPEATARVTTPRPNDTEHMAATVVSPAFQGKSLVEQHTLVQEAVSEHLTTDIHALKIKTYTPADAPADAPGASE